MIVTNNDMKQSATLRSLMGFAVTALGGTLLHYLYDLLGGAKWIAPFSGVNESTWEHMKLLFWPMLLYAVIESFFFRGSRDFWCIKLRGILLGQLLIPVLFYTYNGVIGTSPDWINITIFFVSAATAYYYEARLSKKEHTCPLPAALSAAILITIAVLFAVFTFKTPTLGIFRDPLTGTFGI